MRIFLVCPVRNATAEQKAEIDTYIKQATSAGHEVYYPARDTDQNDDTGYRICSDNMHAIDNAEMVSVYYDKNSSGTLFDLGVAFALGKRITVINDVEDGKGKSFSRMITDWAERSNHSKWEVIGR